MRTTKGWFGSIDDNPYRLSLLGWCVLLPVALFIFCADWVYYKFFYDWKNEEDVA